MGAMSPMRPMGKNTQNITKPAVRSEACPDGAPAVGRKSNSIDSIDSIERKSEAAEDPGDWAGSSPRGSAGCPDGAHAVGYGSGRSPR